MKKKLSIYLILLSAAFLFFSDVKFAFAATCDEKCQADGAEFGACSKYENKYYESHNSICYYGGRYNLNTSAKNAINKGNWGCSPLDGDCWCSMKKTPCTAQMGYCDFLGCQKNCNNGCTKSGAAFGACSTITKSFEFINNNTCNYGRYQINDTSAGTKYNGGENYECGGSFLGDCWCAQNQTTPCASATKCTASGCTPDSGGGADGGADGDVGNNGNGGGGITLNNEYPVFPGGIDIKTKEGQQLNSIIAWLYYAIIGISGFIAFLMIIFGGVQYLTSAGNASAINEAKDRIKSALLGLLIIFASYMIIQTINPTLTILKLP